MESSHKITRRELVKIAGLSSLTIMANNRKSVSAGEKQNKIRFGGPVFEKYDSPEAWIAALKKLGYSAAYCPVDAKQSDDVINAYAKAAKAADIIISEVGVWNNPLDADEAKSREAIERCRMQLALADKIGARCCVNISGSVGKKWDGPDPNNLTPKTFDRIVEITRSIIDAVKPTRTFFTLETMPWAYPDSPDAYLRLIKAIDRKQFAAHLDPVNLVCSPQRFFNNGDLIRECFAKFGSYIKSCHAKDTILRDTLTTHIDEIRPGLGGLDYSVFLTELSKYPDTPLMLEHLSSAEEYNQAAQYIRSVGQKLGLEFV